jgi:hypothetical protein
MGQAKITMHLNKDFELTLQSNSVFRREASIDPKEMTFNGDFKDYMGEDLIQEGSYTKGRKSGLHTTYKGGALQSSIEFFDQDFTILELTGPDGQRQVKEGSGKFSIGFIFLDNFFVIRQWSTGTLTGEFQRGKRVGTWTYSPDHGKGIYEESYEDGKFTKAVARSPRSTYDCKKMNVNISQSSLEIEKFNFDKSQFINLYQYIKTFPIDNIDSLERGVAFPGGISKLVDHDQFEIS